MNKYILDEHNNPVPCDIFTWGKFFETERRIVRQEQVGEYWISTVFLGIDLGWGHGPPVLFETMVFLNDWGGIDQDRCCTWAEAMWMHQVFVARYTTRLASAAKMLEDLRL